MRAVVFFALPFSHLAAVALAGDTAWVTDAIAGKDMAPTFYGNLRDKGCKVHGTSAVDEVCVIAWNALINERVSVEKVLLEKIQKSHDSKQVARWTQVYDAFNRYGSQVAVELRNLYPEGQK